MLLKSTSLLWWVHHPETLLHRMLGSVRNRRALSDLRGLLIITVESLLGVTTGGDVDASDWYPDATGYQPTPYGALPAILPNVNSDDIFIDLGCGKGRVLWFLATRRKLKRIVGIEIVPELVQIARKNMAKCGLLTPVSVVEGDASEVDLSEGTVYFLFNPFGEKTLRKVLENIRNSLLAHPRSIRILYCNPELAHVLDIAAWLRAGRDNRHFRVWKNQT